MFKEFWQDKKHIIESTGILTAIGALFLNIKIPEDELAKNALLNIQMVWLLIISIMGLILFFNFAVFTANVEKSIEKKISREMPQSFFFLFVFVSGCWFLFNLWKYLYLLYKEELSKFLFFLNTIPLAIASIIIIYFKDTYINLYANSKKYKYYITIIFISIGSGLTFSLLSSLIILKIDIYLFLMYFTTSFLISFLYCLFSTLWNLKNNKKLIC